MDFQSFLNQKEISRYRLSKISGVPQTTITDICAGRSNIEKCSAKTVQRLANALGCTMEELMEFKLPEEDTDVPQDKAYLECGLPPFLEESIEAMRIAWEKKDHGIPYLRWDCDYCNLQADINVAETEQIISTEQAWYLREKYLRIERDD